MLKNLMRKFKRLFSSMPPVEKIAVAVLTAVFAVSILHLAITSIVGKSQSGRGDIFVEGMVGRIRALNPLFVDFNDADRDLSRLIFSGLMRYDHETKNFFPDLAAEWSRSKDGLVYTFTVRTNAKWHDGAPVTVDDIIFTFQTIIQNPAFRNPVLKNSFDGVQVASPSPNTVTFTLPKQNSFFISQMTTGIVPKHLLENVPPADLDVSAFSREPVGTGPYRLIALRLDDDGDIIDL